MSVKPVLRHRIKTGSLIMRAQVSATVGCAFGLRLTADLFIRLVEDYRTLFLKWGRLFALKKGKFSFFVF